MASDLDKINIATVVEALSSSSDSASELSLPFTDASSEIQTSEAAEVSLPLAPSHVAELLDQVDRALGEWKVEPALAILTSICENRSKAGRLWRLIALVRLYFPQSGRTIIEAIHNSHSDVFAFLEFLQGLITGGSTPDTPEEEVQVFSQSPDLKFSVDPKLGTQQFKTTNPPPSQIMDFIDAHMTIIKPVMGFLALIAGAAGITSLLDGVLFGSMTKDIVKLAATINAKKVILAEVSGATDSLMSALYSWMGREYVAPEHRYLQSLSEAIGKLQQECYRFEDALKFDFFGTMRNDQIEIIAEHLANFEKRYYTLTSEQKTLLNFRSRMDEINNFLQQIRERRRQLFKSAGGKQEPVRVWMFGDPGIGKTRINLSLANMIAKETGLTTYARASKDPYTSGYVGQGIWIQEDMCALSMEMI